jgi:hypothetical protein
MTQSEKNMLLVLVKEIERLRAMQDLHAAHVGTGVNPAVADVAMQQALKDNQPRFDRLRKEIDAL